MKKNLYAFLTGFDDDSLSFGAWQAMIQEGVKAWNEQNGCELDEHDTMLAYYRKKNRLRMGEERTSQNVPHTVP